MKFGLSLISGVHSKEREAIMSRSLISLANTDTSGFPEKPKLLCTINTYVPSYKQLFDMLSINFDFEVVKEPDTIKGAMPVAVASASILLLIPDITHVVFLWDDF